MVLVQVFERYHRLGREVVAALGHVETHDVPQQFISSGQALDEEQVLVASPGPSVVDSLHLGSKMLGNGGDPAQKADT